VTMASDDAACCLPGLGRAGEGASMTMLRMLAHAR
jgi:hypothetical protein